MNSEITIESGQATSMRRTSGADMLAVLAPAAAVMIGGAFWVAIIWLGIALLS